MTAPTVFVSYSHDSPEHKKWVLKLATDLRTNGVNAILDTWELAPGQDLAAFMTAGIARSDRVLMICSASYVTKADGGSGGVGYERLIVTGELVQDIDTKKFIPVMRGNPKNAAPSFMGPRLYIDLNDDAKYEIVLESLLRELLGEPASVKPPLGSNPFVGTVTQPLGSARLVTPMGSTPDGRLVIDDRWFLTQEAHATERIGTIGLQAHMELRFGLHDSINKSQVDLLAAVRGAGIHTFGWPLGVILDNRDEFRPHPFGDGIRAEIAIDSKGFAGRPSYDYWAMRSNGDFYLLQSLFEDQRSEHKVFFNTRIVRVTEALLFARNLYGRLGAAEESRLTVRVAHRGLAGRSLTSSSFNRDVIPALAHENECQSETTIVLGGVSEELVDHVQSLLAPMFMLFDFKEFNHLVYEDIVRRFEKGEVS